jgi:hypothetical protein
MHAGSSSYSLNWVSSYGSATQRRSRRSESQKTDREDARLCGSCCWKIGFRESRCPIQRIGWCRCARGAAWVKGAVDEWTDAATRAWRLENVWSVSWYTGTTTSYCPDRYQTRQPHWRWCGTVHRPNWRGEGFVFRAVAD